MNNPPIVAVVGRPNVGKSTFVNRLVGKRQSIVDDAPGITRDRLYFDVKWLDKPFCVIDTGGIVPNQDDDIMNSILAQAEIAVEQADKIIFLVDGSVGVHPVEFDIANILRKTKKPVFLVVNKVDSPSKNDLLMSFYELGLSEPIGISALHGCGGIGDLLDTLTQDFPSVDEEKLPDEKIKIAIVGKPNAGKSSIVNALLREDRVIVSDVAGTTRDSIDSIVKYNHQEFILVDTAGIRKKSKVDWGVEKFAVDRAIRAVRSCNIAVLVIDALSNISDQDKKIAQLVIESGKGLIVAINKWDIVENKQSNTLSTYKKNLEAEVPFLNFVPKIFVSALTHQRLNQIFEESVKIYEQINKRISTSILNKVITDAYLMNPPTSFKGKRLKIYYVTQSKQTPPTFVFFVNDEKLFKDNYKRYIEKQLREAFGFFGTPIKLSIKEKSEK